MSQSARLFSICLARFRFLESDQQKIRPVIVVGHPKGKRHILMAIPISSTSVSEPVDVVLENWREVGLLKPSVVRVHRLSAMLEDDLLEEIGEIDDRHKQEIKSSHENVAQSELKARVRTTELEFDCS